MQSSTVEVIKVLKKGLQTLEECISLKDAAIKKAFSDAVEVAEGKRDLEVQKAESLKLKSYEAIQELYDEYVSLAEGFMKISGEKIEVKFQKAFPNNKKQKRKV